MSAEAEVSYRVAVIGGGLAGISAAHALRRAGVQITLYEQADRLGGKVQSWRADSRSVEHGVHGWWPAYRNLFRLLEQLGVGIPFKEAGSSNLIYLDGRVHRVARSGWSLFPPAQIVGWILNTPGVFLSSVPSLPRFLAVAYAFLREPDVVAFDGFSFEDLLEKLHIPEDVRATVLRPFIYAFCFDHAANVSAAAGLGALSFYILRGDSLAQPYWCTGLPDEVIFQPILKKLANEGVTVRLETGVRSIVNDGNYVRVEHCSAQQVAPASNRLSVAASAVPQTGFLRVDASPFTCYVKRSGVGVFAAVDARCTHMGCMVEWQPAMRAFVCPCHGGRYDESGTPIGGPPTRPLAALACSVRGPSVEIQPISAPPVCEHFDAVVVATDAAAAQTLVGTLGALSPGAAAAFRVLSTTPVIVVRVWFDRDYYGNSGEDFESGVAIELPFIDTLFILNRFSSLYDAEGLVVESQCYRASRYIELTDAEIVAAFLSDFRIVRPEARTEHVVASMVMRMRPAKSS